MTRAAKMDRGAIQKSTVLLPQTARSERRTEQQMQERLQTLEEGTLRFRVLTSAIEFKRSWIDLASHLSQVLKAGSFKEWGYRTFEAYAQHELHVKRDTALKLTRSFDFLAAHEKALLAPSRADRPLPDFQAVDILAGARANPSLSESDYREIRDQVFEEDLTPGKLKKLIREKSPELKENIEESPEDRLRKCLQLAERLYGLLLEIEDLPEKIATAVEEAVGGLRRMVDD